MNWLQGPWPWLIGGAILLAAEMIAPGIFLIFIGAAAIVTGIFAWLFDLGLEMQLVLFSLYAIVAVLAGRKFYARDDGHEVDDKLNDRGARLIGRTVTAVAPVDDSGGRVRVGDSEWSARGGPAEPGQKVKITGIEGNCLTVETVRRPSLFNGA